MHVSHYQDTEVTVEDDYVEMEMDELNQHECMASLAALLQHMRRNSITPAVEKVADRPSDKFCLVSLCSVCCPSLIG